MGLRTLSGLRRCFPVFPKVDTPYGQAPLGLEGSGAFRRPGSMVRVLRTERWVRPTERAGSEGSFICCLGQRKPYNRPAGVGKQANLAPLEEMHSPFGGWRHHLSAPLGSVSLDSQSPTTLCESSSLATTSWWDYGCLAVGPCLYRKAWSSLFCPPDGGAGNTIRKGAKRPENRVTRFPVEKVRRSRIRGGERSEPIRRMLIKLYDS